jgi:OFA family oxalate/formate antiporter-like MFS transporter
MYSAKGVSAFVVPLANILKVHTGSWHAVFVVASVMNLLVVAAALFIVRPMRLSMSAAEKQNAVPQPAE